MIRAPLSVAQSPPKLYSYAAQSFELERWRSVAPLLRRVFRAAGGDTLFLPDAYLCPYGLSLKMEL